MTELEQHLLTALENLSNQYAEDMRILENQISNLAQQVQHLAQQNDELIKRYNQVAKLLAEELEK